MNWNLEFQDKTMGDSKALDDKYNVEAAEILANEAQVSFWYFQFGYFHFFIGC